MLREFADRIWAGLEAIGSMTEPEAPEVKQKRLAREIASCVMDSSLDPILDGKSFPTGAMDAFLNYPGLITTATRLKSAQEEWAKLKLTTDERNALLNQGIAEIHGYADYATLGREDSELKYAIELRIVKAGLIAERRLNAKKK